MAELATPHNSEGNNVLRLILDEMDGKDVADTQFKLGNWFYHIYKVQLAKKMFELAVEQGNTQAKEMLKEMST